MPISYTLSHLRQNQHLMNTTLLNNPTKFGAKIFRRYQVITFYVLGHFFSRTLYTKNNMETAIFVFSVRKLLSVRFSSISYQMLLLVDLKKSAITVKKWPVKEQ